MRKAGKFVNQLFVDDHIEPATEFYLIICQYIFLPKWEKWLGLKIAITAVIFGAGIVTDTYYNSFLWSPAIGGFYYKTLTWYIL